MVGITPTHTHAHMHAQERTTHARMCTHSHVLVCIHSECPGLDVSLSRATVKAITVAAVKSMFGLVGVGQHRVDVLMVNEEASTAVLAMSNKYVM